MTITRLRAWPPPRLTLPVADGGESGPATFVEHKHTDLQLQGRYGHGYHRWYRREIHDDQLAILTSEGLRLRLAALGDRSGGITVEPDGRLRINLSTIHNWS